MKPPKIGHRPWELRGTINYKKCGHRGREGVSQTETYGRLPNALYFVYSYQPWVGVNFERRVISFLEELKSMRGNFRFEISSEIGLIGKS